MHNSVIESSRLSPVGRPCLAPIAPATQSVRRLLCRTRGTPDDVVVEARGGLVGKQAQGRKPPRRNFYPSRGVLYASSTLDEIDPTRKRYYAKAANRNESLYAEGVTRFSLGSRSAPWDRRCDIPRYPEGVAQIVCGQGVRVVEPRWGTVVIRRRRPRVRCATLGWRIQPLRGRCGALQAWRYATELQHPSIATLPGFPGFQQARPRRACRWGQMYAGMGAAAIDFPPGAFLE